MQKGVVFNIQRYSLQDGPGIRTTVFLKGCPLNCWWCHNPESKDANIQMTYSEKRCIRCSRCIKQCKSSAIDLQNQSNILRKDKCINCGNCVEFCPTNALQLIGREMTVSEVMEEIEKDRVFYEESKGGVTFSGGEPLMQGEFLYEVLRACKEVGISTAVDTCGFASWTILEKVAQYTDLFLYDLKHMEDEIHHRLTGVSNKPIIDNLKKLASNNTNIHIRIPLIPTVNDARENMGATGALLSSIGLKEVSLLPYHSIAIDKYKRIGEVYKLSEIQEPTQEKIEEMVEILKSYKIKVTIGG